MGTSTSYRSPMTPRWSAFASALVGNESVDRIRSELFNAGNEWRDALAAPAVASFATTVESLHAGLAERLESVQSATALVRLVLAEARTASHEAGFSPAAPVAERALARWLLGSLGGADAPAAAAEQWAANRGATTGEAVTRYLGEVLAQFARHVVDREAGHLAERDVGAAASATLSAELATAANTLAVVAGRVGDTDERAATRWNRMIAAAFEAGGALPGRPR
jgi:hypothetical protein